jgi:hypothetical protein
MPRTRPERRGGRPVTFLSDEDIDETRSVDEDKDDRDDEGEGEGEDGYIGRAEFMAAVQELDNRNADRFDQLRQDLRERVDDRVEATAPATTPAPVAGNGHGDVRTVLDRLDDATAAADRARRRGEQLSDATIARVARATAVAACDELEGRFAVSDEEGESESEDDGGAKGKKSGAKENGAKKEPAKQEDRPPERLYYDFGNGQRFFDAPFTT